MHFPIIVAYVRRRLPIEAFSFGARRAFRRVALRVDLFAAVRLREAFVLPATAAGFVFGRRVDGAFAVAFVPRCRGFVSAAEFSLRFLEMFVRNFSYQTGGT